MQVASPNSPCDARGRGKRTPENPKIRKIAKNANIWSQPYLSRGSKLNWDILGF